MSNPGMTMTPQQQYQMAMARALMGNQAQGQNSGIANLGGNILGALAMKRVQQQNDPENQVVQQRYGMTPGQAGGVLGTTSPIAKMFGLGQ